MQNYLQAYYRDFYYIKDLLSNSTILYNIAYVTLRLTCQDCLPDNEEGQGLWKLRVGGKE